MAKMFITTPRMALVCVCLLVSGVLVFEAADASLVTRVNHLASTPNPTAASPASASVKDGDDTEISYGAMNRDGIPCDPNKEANCEAATSGNGYVRGCSPIDRCRCCRKMLLEAQVEGVADNVTQYFGGLKDDLTSKFAR